MIAKLRLAACISLLVAGCAEPENKSASPILPVDKGMPLTTLSKSLSPGMTEAQVVALRDPDKITLETCGQTVGKPWQCKAYQYYFPYQERLRVLFDQTSSGEWRVNSWF